MFVALALTLYHIATRTKHSLIYVAVLHFVHRVHNETACHFAVENEH